MSLHPIITHVMETFNYEESQAKQYVNDLRKEVLDLVFLDDLEEAEFLLEERLKTSKFFLTDLLF